MNMWWEAGDIKVCAHKMECLGKSTPGKLSWGPSVFFFSHNSILFEGLTELQQIPFAGDIHDVPTPLPWMADFI